MRNSRTLRSALFACFCVAFFSAKSQCPPSKQAGVHVVQKGETLYSISRKYGVSVPELCAWNRREKNEVLSECTRLTVKKTDAAQAARPVEQTAPSNKPAAVAPQSAPASTGRFSSTTSRLKKQTGGKHIVAEGETLDEIARLYGYTTERFAGFNGFSESYVVRTGDLLRSTDCSCPGNEEASDPRVIATYYITHPEGTTAPPQNLAPDKYSSATTTAPPSTSGTSPSHSANQAATQQASPPQSTGNRPASTNFGDDGTYMSTDERAMVAEINLLRSNPAGYVRYVEEFIDYMKKYGEEHSSIATAKELIAELRQTPALSTLKPAECVFRAAKKHGEDRQRAGTGEHRGTDGSWPWDRILRECPDFADGNENLVGGPNDIRRSVMLLLVDDGIENRGHRKTLLNPNWDYVACAKIGTIGKMPNYWVQNFADADGAAGMTTSNAAPTSNNTGNMAADKETATTNNPPAAPVSSGPPAKAVGSFMTDEERAMVDEINLMRSDPAGYVRYVEEFIEHLRKNGEFGSSIATARELIEELKRTPRLSTLETPECIFTAAKKHGIDQRPMGDVNHEGRDGSQPYERIFRQCPDFRDGSENICGGQSDVRRSLMYLLVDHGIDNRGHRRNLLNPAWRYVGCYKVGTVGTMPHCWVHDFAY